MPILLKLVALLLVTTIYAQPSTEVYLMDLDTSEEKITLSNFKNVSQNKGYDNQPSFAGDHLYFAGNNNGQTDIAQYSLKDGSKKWVNKTTPGGEYSPTLIPNTQLVAAVRLDTSGLQRLYGYDLNTGENSLLVRDLAVAYFAIPDNQHLLSVVLSTGQLDLVVVNFKTNSRDTLLLNAGRSLHKVPTSKAMSYTAVNEEGNYDIYQLDLESKESFFVTQLPVGVQDHIWLNDSKLLCGSGSKLYVLDLFGSGDWKLAADLSAYKIKDITRLAVSPDGSKLAVVAEPDSETKK